MKICGKCKVEKEESEFSKDKSKKDGLCRQCKKCDQEHYIDNKEKILKQRKIYYSNNNEQIKEYQKEYYVKNKSEIIIKQNKYALTHKDHKKEYDKRRYINNKNKVLEYHKEYYTNNKKRIAEKAKVYRLKNKARLKKNNKEYYISNDKRIKENVKIWRRNNPDKVLKNHIKRQALMVKKTIIEFTAKQLEQRLSMFGNHCVYCGVEFSKDNPLEKDHTIPLSRGGYHCLANIRPACRHCNASKSNKLLSEWDH